MPFASTITQAKTDPVTGDQSIPKSDPLRLDQFLKLRAIAETGGRAKLMIQGGEVKVNGELETRRRRKLSAGDVVEIGGQQFVVDNEHGPLVD